MPAVDVQFSPAQIKAVQQELQRIKNGVPIALAGAANDTAKTEKTRISSGIRQKVPIKKADIDKYINISPRATPSSPSTGIHLSKSKRIPLQYFGAYQTGSNFVIRVGQLKRLQKKYGESAGIGGVRYTIGKKFVSGAFMGPNPGEIAVKLHGGVFIRTGRARLPIRKLFGPSPWGVFVKSGMLQPTVNETNALLAKNLQHRVRFLLLKQSGQI